MHHCELSQENKTSVFLPQTENRRLFSCVQQTLNYVTAQWSTMHLNQGTPSGHMGAWHVVRNPKRLCNLRQAIYPQVSRVWDTCTHQG